MTSRRTTRTYIVTERALSLSSFCLPWIRIFPPPLLSNLWQLGGLRPFRIVRNFGFLLCHLFGPTNFQIRILLVALRRHCGNFFRRRRLRSWCRSFWCRLRRLAFPDRWRWGQAWRSHGRDLFRRALRILPTAKARGLPSGWGGFFDGCYLRLLAFGIIFTIRIVRSILITPRRY